MHILLLYRRNKYKRYLKLRYVFHFHKMFPVRSVEKLGCVAAIAYRYYSRAHNM